MSQASSEPLTPAAGSIRASADLIVVGSGVAGLRAAIEAASAGLQVIVLAKDAARESTTGRAQGGVAVALSDEDQVGLHLQDTLDAGAGLCDGRAVRVLVEEGPRYITELIDWGAQFDRDGSRLAFTREAAHSARRILHAGGDSTGQEILRVLLRKARSLQGISHLTNVYTVDVLVEEGRCSGVLCLEEGTGDLSEIRGPVLLATGGCGRVFRETTNPPQATGDGVAMACRSGAWVRDLEFVQFHPTSLWLEGAPRFLLSEAIRGEGAYLRDASGTRFMKKVEPARAELAPRDTVARAIAQELLRSGESHVFLDLTHMDPDFVRRRFPMIHATCLQYGLEITRSPIPVAPSAHYLMGGVATDLRGRTSVPGLYAAGEVACTGVHGANRLASNSLLEGLVYGARSGEAVIADARGDSHGPREAPPWRPGESPPANLPLDRGASAVAPGAAGQAADRVREIAWTDLGLLRGSESLSRAHDALEQLGDAGEEDLTRPGIEARNVALVAALIADAALRRQESRGAHYRTDHPRTDDSRFRRSFLQRCDGLVCAAELSAPGDES